MEGEIRGVLEAVSLARLTGDVRPAHHGAQSEESLDRPGGDPSGGLREGDSSSHTKARPVFTPAGRRGPQGDE